jgi:hypothetical protein
VSEQSDINLLADIARLIVKHGPQPFEDLAQRLRDGRLIDDLAALLDASAQAGRQSKRPLGSKHTGAKALIGINEILRQCEVESPEKAHSLRQLHEKLIAGTLLPTLRDIRHFAEDNGLPTVTAKSRNKAILSLIRAVSSLPLERITSLMVRALQLEQKGERTLEGWTDVILGSRNKGSQNK